jgi:two-component system, sensor histidine kinase
MINDILDFTQISNGKLRINPSKFCVMTIVKEVSKLIKFRAKKKGIDLIIENRFPFERRVHILSDPNRLKQILLNLLGNGLKFTEEGFVKIIIEPAEENPSSFLLSKAVKFVVEDSGIGIKEEDIPRLFRLFGMIDNEDSLRVNQTGVGLGLSISQNLLKYLNQEREEFNIKAKSEWKKGSRFEFILLPYFDYVLQGENNQDRSFILSADLDEGEVTLKDIPHCEPTAFMMTKKNNIKKIPNQRRILIVDDDQINIAVFSRYFEGLKEYLCEIAFNGLQAVQMVEKSIETEAFFDLIIMDCNMPIMDGFEASRIIMNMIREKKIPSLKIVASTANSSEKDFENCFRNGMVDVIPKPFSKSKMLETIKKYLKQP